jgi:hypothetical protein
MMKPLYHLAIISLAVASSTPTFAEPYSPSCEISLERIDTARKALVPFRHTMEMAQAHAAGANAETSTCTGEDRLKVKPPLHCHKSQWQAPKPTKYDLAAVDQYRQKRQGFEELFQQVKQICLREP